MMKGLGWESTLQRRSADGTNGCHMCNLYDTKRRSHKQILKNPDDSQRGRNSSIKVCRCHSVTFPKTGTYIRSARGPCDDQRTNATKMRHVLEKDWTTSSSFINYSTLNNTKTHIGSPPVYSIKESNTHPLPINHNSTPGDPICNLTFANAFCFP